MNLKTFWHRLGSPRWFYDISRSWMFAFGGLAAILLVVGTVWGLAFAPVDYQQGHSFRIIYVHVPTALVAQTAYIVMGVAGVVLLVWRMKLADMVLACIVPFGMSMTALSLLTGVLWSKRTWIAEGDPTWWVWDARTTSMLVLLFLYFGLYALRQAIPRQETAGRACAVLAILGMINIPIIKYSVDWWRTLHQPASFTLTESPAMPMEMWLPLLLNVLGIYLLFGANLISRVRLEVLRRERGTQWVSDVIRADLA